MPHALKEDLAALEDEDFADLVTRFVPFQEKIAVAVSGGSDSMALAFCLKRWAGQSLVAFIVDHALRDESAAEAAQVKARLENLGIETEILRWEHPPIAARLHEKARQARYDLLSAACKRHGAKDLFLGHHREDQAETILMRLAKGSGIEGLSGMAPENLRNEIRLLRPFLSVSKTRLISTCTAAGIEFVTDPSNMSEKFARGRLRKNADLLAQEGMTIDSLLKLGARAAEVKDALDFYTTELLRATVVLEPGGTLCVDRHAFCRTPRATGLRALAACLRYIHDDVYPPEHKALSLLWDIFSSLAAEATRTLSGCLVTMTENKICFLREVSAITDILPLRDNTPVLWDGRWLVMPPKLLEAKPLTIRALGNPPHAEIDLLSPLLRRQIPRGRVRASLPALWVGETLYALPSFDDPEAPLHISYTKKAFWLF